MKSVAFRPCLAAGLAVSFLLQKKIIGKLLVATGSCQYF
jgi:hypothetical protein